MTLHCNIDRRGRTIRAWIGGLISGEGILLLLQGRWLGGALAILAGLLVLFEAWRSWCILRAMGIRTPV